MKTKAEVFILKKMHMEKTERERDTDQLSTVFPRRLDPFNSFYNKSVHKLDQDFLDIQ